MVLRLLTTLEKLGATLSNAACTVTEIGISDLIETGPPVSVESLAQSAGADQRLRANFHDSYFDYGECY